MRLLKGDCLELMQDLPTNSVDMVLCDFPYGMTDCKWDNIIPYEPLWKQYERITKDNGVIVLFSAQPFTTKLIHSNLKNFRYCWYWVKNAATGFAYARYQPRRKVEDICVFYKTNSEYIGASSDFEPIRKYLNSERKKTNLSNKEFKELLGNNMASHYFTNGIQWILPNEAAYKKLQSTGYFKKDYKELLKEYNKIKGNRTKSNNLSVTYNPQGLKLIENPKPKKRTDYGKDYAVKIRTKCNEYTPKYTGYPHNVLEYSKEPKSLHPTQKPVALLEYLIKTYTNEGETVLDNCMGSGSTGVACVNTNRRFIGMELTDHYYNIAKERIHNARASVTG